MARVPVSDESAVAAPLGGAAASSVAWMTAQKWVVRLAGLATIAILTRLVSPAEFGTIAVASTILPFLYLISDLGFATYIVQAQKADRRTVSTAFWFSITVGAALTVLLIVAAPLVAALFGAPDAAPVIRVLALTVPLTALSSVPIALLRRSMRFQALAAQSLAASLIAQVVAVVLAFSGAGVWALVAQSLAAQVVTTLLVIIAARWMPAWSFSIAEFTVMARFGTQVLGVELVAMGRAAAEAAIITHALGLTTLGYLTIAQRLVQVVQDLTGSAVLPVATVAFAKMRGEGPRTQRAYLRALGLAYACMAAPLLLVAVAAPLIVPIVFGDGWEQSFPLTQVLAVAGIVVVGATLDQGLFYALGRPGRWLVYAVAIDALTVAVTAVTAQWGILPVVWGFLGVTVIATITRWFLVAKLLDAPVVRVAKPFGYLAATVVFCGAAGLAVVTVTSDWGAVLRIIAAGATILVVHLGVTALLARQTLADLRRYGGKVLARMRRERKEEQTT